MKTTQNDGTLHIHTPSGNEYHDQECMMTSSLYQGNPNVSLDSNKPPCFTVDFLANICALGWSTTGRTIWSGGTISGETTYGMAAIDLMHYVTKQRARDAGSHLAFRMAKKTPELRLFVAICMGISLNLAGMLTTYKRTIIYLEDSYAAVHLSAITVECTVLL